MGDSNEEDRDLLAEQIIKDRNLGEEIAATYKDQIPNYANEVETTDHTMPVIMQRLNALVLKMSQLELQEMDLEDQLTAVKKELRTYKENLVPELMSEIGLTQLKTAGGTIVELREEIRASFPKDEAKQAQAFAWLKSTGNDGLVKREISVRYGRDSVQWADELVRKLDEWGVGEHGVVDQEWTVHHQTLLAFLRGELKEGREVPFEIFGAIVQKFAKIKRAK